MVEGGVGAAHELLAGRVRLVVGDAEADRHLERPLGARHAVRLHALADALGDEVRPLEVGLREEGADLLAAEACGQVDLAQAVADDLRRLAQHRVADLVPPGVVEFLEVVDVDHDMRAKVRP
jgi:hypothetical protein